MPFWKVAIVFEIKSQNLEKFQLNKDDIEFKGSGNVFFTVIKSAINNCGIKVSNKYCP